MKNPWLPIGILLLVLCALPTQAQQVVFTPAQGFSGGSKGDGRLRMLFGKSRPYHVDSFGQEQGDRTFRLDQKVTFEGRPTQHRFWLIREAEPLRYVGTLSDASGPIAGQTVGSRLSLRYRVKAIFVMHQELALSQDRRTIDNSGRITFLGIPVGFLHEIIRREDH